LTGRHVSMGISAVAALALLLGGMYQHNSAVMAAQRSQQQAPEEHGVPMTGVHLPFPQHPPRPPEVIERGKNLYGVNCGFCHGADAAGGSVGPNLLRSQIVIQDQDGELLAPVVHGGRADRGMPAIDLTQAQISDIAAFLHTFQTGENERAAEPINIVVGDAAAGKIAFQNICSSCHSVTGDLAGIASKVTNPRNLQQAWLLPSGPGRPVPGPQQPGGAPNLRIHPMMATVTLPSGQKVEGTVERVDDFYIGLTTPDGSFRSFVLNGDTPRVELQDPMTAHRELFRKYTDKEIHDITAYLVTLK
jgi:cytochrome c oxidase cbb3-type subunit III